MFYVLVSTAQDHKPCSTVKIMIMETGVLLKAVWKSFEMKQRN